MPVGGGHHGGGHHGGGNHGGGHHGGGHHGGGHHGGGHHHHYGHHHGGHYHGHYHHGYMGPIYYSPFRWFYRLIILFVIIFIASIVLFSVGLASFFSGPSIKSVNASPEDYRLLAFAQSSCGQIELSTSQLSYPINLYLLDTPPSRVQGDEFTITHNWKIDYDSYQYYNFYLLQDSTIGVSFSVSYSSITFYILNAKQFHNFDRGHTFTYDKKVICSASQPCNSADYPVPKNDEYYILFDAKSFSTQVQHTLTIHKYIYSFSDNDVFDDCEASCSLPVPSSPKLYPLVVTGNVTFTRDWTADVPYEWHCTNAKLSLPTWVYVITIVGALVLVVSVVGAILTGVVLLYRKKKSTNDIATAPLISTPTPHMVTAPQPVAPPQYFVPPPPVNPYPPSYQDAGPPPGYKS